MKPSGDDKQRSRTPQKVRVDRGLLFALLVLLSGFLLGLQFELFERLIDWLESVERFEADEIFIGLLLVTPITATLALVRERSIRREEHLRRAAEREAVAANHRATLASLAGGLAHEINNQLMVIGGVASVAEAEGPKDRLEDDLRTIQVAVAKAARVTRTMLAYTGQVIAPAKLVDVGEHLEMAQKVLEVEFDAVEVLVELDDGPQQVLVDPDVLVEVLLELLRNASRAIDGRGVIRVRIYLDDRDESFTVIEVSDDGGGIDNMTLPRVTEPFFTTHNRAEASGLGLALVAGFAQSTGGDLKLESKVGEGTTVSLRVGRLPQLDSPTAGSAI